MCTCLKLSRMADKAQLPTPAWRLSFSYPPSQCWLGFFCSPIPPNLLILPCGSASPPIMLTLPCTLTYLDHISSTDPDTGKCVHKVGSNLWLITQFKVSYVIIYQVPQTCTHAHRHPCRSDQICYWWTLHSFLSSMRTFHYLHSILFFYISLE